jgi:geranylgeranyl pyrophosphate synthase
MRTPLGRKICISLRATCKWCRIFACCNAPDKLRCRSDTLNLEAHPDALSCDPFDQIAPEIAAVNGSIRNLLGIDHPVLAKTAQYFFEGTDNASGGKKVRPAMVLLMSQAVNSHMNDGHQSISALQRRLAEITEMIHTASLLHDDVIDMADTRRGRKSVNNVFGNKLAVLAGDFLLARASVCLARLRNIPVVELLSTVIEHLVKGEVMQMRTALRNEAAGTAAFHMYLRKT